MDKKTLMEELADKAHDAGVFTGAWLYAEHGEAGYGFGWYIKNDPEY